MTKLLRALAVLLTLAGCRRRGPSAPRPARVSEREVTVAGLRLHVREVASEARAATLIVHGGPGLDSTYMRPWFDELRDVTRVLYVDLRGHGRSSPPPDGDGYTINAAADDLAMLIERDSAAPADVIAHDFGATVAMSLAARHPGLVRRLVLIAPLRDGAQVRDVGRRSQEVLGAQGWQAIQALSTPQGTLRDAHQLPALFRRLGPMWWHRPPSDETIRSLTGTMVYRPEADANFLSAVRRWSAVLVAPDVRAPTLVISGDDDRTFLPAESRALSEVMPHGSFVSIADAGHLPFVERTRETLRAVRAFR